MNALLLKTCLLYYYRFKRGYLCSDEVYSTYGQKADILVDTKNNLVRPEGLEPSTLSLKGICSTN